VLIAAALDATSGLVTWNLQAIDPKTGEPPLDPSNGFLPPNVAPPEGAGGASFTVQPQAGLETGDVISDSATIVFDQNAPIQTAPWLNTIDTSTPSSHIASVSQAPAGGDCGNLGVAWSGTDSGAGIDHYEIYVSKDGGPFEIWQPITAATSAIFPGSVGTSYSFASVATDGVLHSETPPGTPSTQVTAACAAGTGINVRSRPPGTPGGVRISDLTFTPSRFAVGKAGAKSVSRHKSRGRGAQSPVGTKIGYELSGAGEVSISIDRRLPGLKLKGHGCVVASAAVHSKLSAEAERTLKKDRLSAAARRRRLAALLRAARCPAARSEGTLKFSGRAGANNVAFSGRLGSRALPEGTYIAKATVSPASRPPSSAGATFQIVAAGAKR